VFTFQYVQDHQGLAALFRTFPDILTLMQPANLLSIMQSVSDSEMDLLNGIASLDSAGHQNTRQAARWLIYRRFRTSTKSNIQHQGEHVFMHAHTPKGFEFSAFNLTELFLWLSHSPAEDRIIAQEHQADMEQLIKDDAALVLSQLELRWNVLMHTPNHGVALRALQNQFSVLCQGTFEPLFADLSKPVAPGQRSVSMLAQIRWVRLATVQSRYWNSTMCSIWHLLHDIKGKNDLQCLLDASFVNADAIIPNGFWDIVLRELGDDECEEIVLKIVLHPDFHRQWCSAIVKHSHLHTFDFLVPYVNRFRTYCEDPQRQSSNFERALCDVRYNWSVNTDATHVSVDFT
jgi:hypothetical protein